MNVSEHTITLCKCVVLHWPNLFLPCVQQSEFDLCCVLVLWLEFLLSQTLVDERKCCVCVCTLQIIAAVVHVYMCVSVSLVFFTSATPKVALYVV